ncbi:hypothetical protein LQ953_14130 [Sphingomonas sp. IC-56]|uniref:ArnT family glycosyltransferase n=1 Tax=Sphingomonas sp. IC-56 TaxID=2898529 RepID=UPI001E3027CA|nr:hypothetical protein [Sphingomonas sp. IC-56]MCD2325156.1 hypothetical protein [Sphingomonas sp. IC-56]
MSVASAVLGIRRWPVPPFIEAVATAPRWLVLLCAAVAARFLTFGNPLVHIDENFYFAAAQQMAHGALPYVDVWDRKPIGLFLIYLPAAALGLPLGIWAYQLMALGSVVLTALLIARMADQAGWRRGALPGALLYVFMLNLAGGQGGQSPVFYNLFMALAASLILVRVDEMLASRHRIARAVLAMALVGLAMQIKYSVVFEGMFFGLWLMWREHRLGANPRQLLSTAAMLAGVAAVPTGLVWSFYMAIGQGDAWIYANVTSIFARQEDPPHIWWHNVREVTLMLAPLVTMSAISACLTAEASLEQTRRRFLLGWLAASVIGLILFGGFFTHYALPVMLPACLCSAGFLGSHPIGRKLMAPLVAVSLVAGTTATYLARQSRGNGAELQALTQAIGSGPGCLFLYSGPPMLYSSTGRCVTTAWLFPRHLSRVREAEAIGVNQLAEIRRIFRARPAIVTVAEPYDGERPDVRRRTLQRLKENGYRLKGVWPVGNDSVAVFEAQAAEATGAPRRAANNPS